MRWIIGAIVLLVIIGMACILYYHHLLAPYKQQAAETDEVVRQYRLSQNSNNEVDTPLTQLPTEKEETHTKELVKKSTLPVSIEDSDPTTGIKDVEVDEVVQPVIVSPFGFGPYPKVPSGYPYDNPWITEGLTEREAKISELLERVRIKLWNEGNPPEGISWEGGKVYPIYPNTVYVDWDYVENEDGTIERYISNATSGTLSDEANALLDEGVIPPGVIVYEHSEVGIDPYKFLNLK